LLASLTVFSVHGTAPKWAASPQKDTRPSKRKWFA
jgi:hypothetical protein